MKNNKSFLFLKQRFHGLPWYFFVMLHRWRVKALGAHVVAIDLPRPQIWQRLIATARGSPGEADAAHEGEGGAVASTRDISSGFLGNSINMYKFYEGKSR